MLLQWFECPHCGHSRQGAMLKVDVAPDSRSMKLLFVCEHCEALSTLKRPALNAAVLFMLGGPLLFALAFFAIAAALPAGLGWLYALPAALGGAAAAFGGVLLLGRFTQRYVPVDGGAAWQ
jgi:hypothetical protein